MAAIFNEMWFHSHEWLYFGAGVKQCKYCRVVTSDAPLTHKVTLSRRQSDGD